MTRGLYIAGTGMMLQRRRMETITNNIVNVETTGYKRDILVSHKFDDVMIERYNDYQDNNLLSRNTAVGPLTFGNQVDQIYTDFSLGNYETTGKSTDLMTTGNGYFVISTPEGERYTKGGAFTINSLGYLTDGSGNYVLGTEGEIYVGTDNFKVNDLGEITRYTNTGVLDDLGEEIIDGEWINTIRVVGFEDMGQLRKQGDNLFFDAGGANPQEFPEGVKVKQGVLESSNVNTAQEMVDMMVTYRAYEMNQKMVQTLDQLNGKAVTEIGRLA